MGRITKEQLAIIESLTCERLTKHEANKVLIQDFENNRNKGLADSLREEAWEEDANGSVAYYLIKDKDGNALFLLLIEMWSTVRAIERRTIGSKHRLLEGNGTYIEKFCEWRPNSESYYGEVAFWQESFR